VAIRSVFDRLAKAASEEQYYLFPAAFGGAIVQARSRGEQVRVVADCIAGMTEKEIMHFHRSLQGLGA
jgi:dGTP triphosphohydrolase